MTQLAAVVLALRPFQPLPRVWTGSFARRWFLEQVKQADAALGDELERGSGIRPFTVSSLWQERPRSTPQPLYLLRITTLTTPLTQLLTDVLLPIWPEQIIQIGELPFQVVSVQPAEHEWVGQGTDAELMRQHGLQLDAPRTIRMRFSSPTFFKGTGDITIPFPLPALVFGGLIERWNTFNEVKLHADTRRFADARVAAASYTLRTRPVRVQLGEQSALFNGCVGVCRYTILQRDGYWRGVLQTLAAYSFYAGVGAHTAIGLGQARLLEDARDEQ